MYLISMSAARLNLAIVPPFRLLSTMSANISFHVIPRTLPCRLHYTSFKYASKLFLSCEAASAASANYSEISIFLKGPERPLYDAGIC